MNLSLFNLHLMCVFTHYSHILIEYCILVQSLTSPNKHSLCLIYTTNILRCHNLNRDSLINVIISDAEEGLCISHINSILQAARGKDQTRIVASRYNTSYAGKSNLIEGWGDTGSRNNQGMLRGGSAVPSTVEPLYGKLNSDPRWPLVFDIGTVELN